MRVRAGGSPNACDFAATDTEFRRFVLGPGQLAGVGLGILKKKRHEGARQLQRLDDAAIHGSFQIAHSDAHVVGREQACLVIV
jgi:hypothetical protein